MKLLSQVEEFNFDGQCGAFDNIVAPVPDLDYGLHLKGPLHPKPLRFLSQHKSMWLAMDHLQLAKSDTNSRGRREVSSMEGRTYLEGCSHVGGLIR